MNTFSFPLAYRHTRLALIGVGLLTGCERESDGRPLAPIDLQEISAYTVPDSFPITGAISATDGTIALISARWSHLLVGKDGVFSEFGVGVLQTPIGVAFDERARISQVVDAGARAIVSFDDEAVAATIPLKIMAKLTSAVHSPSRGWFLAGVDSSGIALVHSPEMVAPQSLASLRDFPQDFNDQVLLTIAPSGDLIVTRPRHPGTWALLRQGRRPIVTQVYDTTSALFDSDSSSFLEPLWVGVGLVPIDRYLLYNLADLRSSDRRLLLLSAEGKLVRHTRLTAPMGFVGHVPNQKSLVAVRDFNTQELVTYRWRWGGAHLFPQAGMTNHEAFTSSSNR